MNSRKDNNFLEMVKALPVHDFVSGTRNATPREVTITDQDMRYVDLVWSRRRQGLRARVRDLNVLNRIATLVRAK